MHLPEEPDLPFQINIVPMIDVIFAILTFFIMSSLFLTKSAGLPVNLPKAATAQDVRSSKLTVTIDTAGGIRLNQQPIQLSELQSRVRLLSRGNPQIVIINADRQVSHGQVVEVMDQLRQIPGMRLAIATKGK
jgi:biopolymer transport protein ExbD